MTPQNYKYCAVEQQGSLLLVTINRPEVRNALHPPANDELDDIWNRFEEDAELRIAIVTGAEDKAFSAGNDLKYQAAGHDMWVPDSGLGGLTSRFNMTKPVIAAVNGAALGGGLEIALACDLIVAAEHATFGLPEPRVGLAALAGGLHRLPRAIGIKPAMSMILTAAPVTAQRAYELGLVCQVTPAKDLLDAAKALATGMSACSPMALRASKDAVLRSMDHSSLAEAVNAQLSYPGIAALFRSHDIQEGPRAFAEKRAPQWRME